MIYTTLNKIRAHGPCTHGWQKLLRHLNKTQADDEPVSLLTILESNGLDDALWALRAVDGHDREIRLYAIWCARQVQHLMTDPRSLIALDVAERHANGQATDDERRAAARAARAAYLEAEAAAEVTTTAAAAEAAAEVASWAAYSAASWAAYLEAEAGATTWVTARATQTSQFRQVFCSVTIQGE